MMNDIYGIDSVLGQMLAPFQGLLSPRCGFHRALPYVAAFALAGQKKIEEVLSF